MNFLDALQIEDTLTENGMVTNSSTLNECVNLFFTIGAMRGQDKERLLSLFSKAFIENPQTALRILFWVRDVRGGAGERQIFRDIIQLLAEVAPKYWQRISNSSLNSVVGTILQSYSIQK